MALTTHPPYSAEVKEGVELYFYSTSYRVNFIIIIIFSSSSSCCSSNEFIGALAAEAIFANLPVRAPYH